MQRKGNLYLCQAVKEGVGKWQAYYPHSNNNNNSEVLSGSQVTVKSNHSIALVLGLFPFRIGSIK